MEDKYTPPEFVRRDPEDKAVLHVDHKEVSGTFTMQKCTFAVRGQLARIKGAFLGPFPDQASEGDAEIFAVVSVGFSKAPEGWNPSEVVDLELMGGLYKEVLAFWASFQGKK